MVPKVVPAILIKKDKISVDDAPHLPDKVKAKYVGRTVSGAYKVCIGQNGLISSVGVVSSIPDADEAVVGTLQTWRYRPQAIPICFVQFLEFSIF